MPTGKDPRNDPSTPSANYVFMLPTWDKVETVLQGTRAMRGAGMGLMPRHENESNDAYSERLQRATLLNLSCLTLDTWVGKPFSEPVEVGDDVPGQVQEWLEDVDLQGNDVSVFARGWFRSGLAKAFSHVLVDAPSDPGDEVRTLADDSREGRRPFLNFIRPENLFAISARVVDGQEIITHARILEQEVVRDGFAEATIERIREFNRILPGDTVLNLMGMEAKREEVQRRGSPDDEEIQAEFFSPGVFVTLWRKEEDDGGKITWIIEQPPTKLDDRMDEIPLVTYYADRDDTLLGKPPLEDLIDLNINWWQSNSDQNTILTVTRFPLLALSGGDEDEVVVEVGPRRMLFTPDARGKFYYVEHTGAAIEAGRKHLEDLENQMAHYGAEFLRRKPGSQTATARALDSAEAVSPLQDAAMRFNDALNRTLELMGKWVGLEDVGTVLVNVEFETLETDNKEADVLDKARARGDLSKKDYFEELQQRGALRETFDFDENEKNLEEEVMEGGDGSLVGEEEIDPFAEVVEA